MGDGGHHGPVRRRPRGGWTGARSGQFLLLALGLIGVIAGASNPYLMTGSSATRIRACRGRVMSLWSCSRPVGLEPPAWRWRAGRLRNLGLLFGNRCPDRSNRTCHHPLQPCRARRGQTPHAGLARLTIPALEGNPMPNENINHAQNSHRERAEHRPHSRTTRLSSNSSPTRPPRRARQRRQGCAAVAR